MYFASLDDRQLTWLSAGSASCSSRTGPPLSARSGGCWRPGAGAVQHLGDRRAPGFAAALVAALAHAFPGDPPTVVAAVPHRYCDLARVAADLAASGRLASRRGGLARRACGHRPLTWPPDSAPEHRCAWRSRPAAGLARTVRLHLRDEIRLPGRDAGRMALPHSAMNTGSPPWVRANVSTGSNSEPGVTAAAVGLGVLWLRQPPRL